MLKKEEYESFSNLLFFENHLNDDKANYVCVSDQYLWRRDSARLVAYKLNEQTEENYHYLLKEFGNEEGYAVQLEKGELILTDQKGEIKKVESSEVPYKTNSIQTLSFTNFDWEVEIEAKSLVKVLLIVQRKVMNQKGNMNLAEVSLNFQEKTLSIHLDGEKTSYELKIENHKVGGNPIATYSYTFFRELLMNANSYGKLVSFRVYQPYFTLIEYNEKIKAVINHKRKKEEEI